MTYGAAPRSDWAFVLLTLAAGTCALPSWPPDGARYMLNPTRGASIATATCRAYYNTPCAIEKIHQIVYELAALLEAATTTAEYDTLLAAVNAKQYNQPVLFWPVILNSSGHMVATGMDPADNYQGPVYVGGFYQDVLEYESRQANPNTGGVFLPSAWEDIQAAAEGDGYVFTEARDAYHVTGAAAQTKTVPRVSYVMKVATAAGDAYVLSAYSDMPLNDELTSYNCTAGLDALCSTAFVRSVLGDVVTAMVKAKDQAELNSVFAAVSNQQHNRYYKGFYTGFYPFIWGMSGLGYAHGANSNNVGTYLNSSARLAIPKLATLHEDLAAAGTGGGGYTAYYWNDRADEPMYLKVSFTVGVHRFGTSYYIGCGYTHETNPVPGPHAGACNFGANQPCAFTNVLNMVGHIHTLTFMSNMYAIETAFDLMTTSSEYIKVQPAGFSSAYRNYGFIYDYNQTCVGHGANAGLVGRRLEDIIAGVARFDGILNGTKLHHDFVAAAEVGGAWVAYPWINAGDSDPYLKLAYLVKIFRDGREYYLGAGLSDVPLIGGAPPTCSPHFSHPCAEEWTLSVAGFRMSTLLQASTYADMQVQLSSTHETDAPVSAGGSPFGFASTVFSASHVLASAHWDGYDTPSWLRAAGLSSDSFLVEAPEGEWLGPWTMKATPHDTDAVPHYVYHITLTINDEVADDQLDGLYDSYHVVVPVRVGEMPPLYDESGSGCTSAAACFRGGVYDETLTCTAPVTYPTHVNYTYGNGTWSMQFCECATDPFVDPTSRVVMAYAPEFTVNWTYATPNSTWVGVEESLQTSYALECHATPLALRDCDAGWVRVGDNCLECEVGTYERDHTICEPAASAYYIPYRGTTEGGDAAAGKPITDCPAGTQVQEVLWDNGEVVVQLRKGGSNASDCTCKTGKYVSAVDEACLVCPDHAACDGNVFPPLALPGYGLLSKTSMNYYPCRGQGRCPGSQCDCIGGQHELGSTSPVAFVSNRARCAEGYVEDSALCSLCDTENDYALQLGECTQCTLPMSSYLALGLAAVLLWFPLVGTITDRCESLEIAFAFVQFLGMYSGFAVEWRPWLQRFLSACAFFNLDLSMMHLACWRQLTYANLWFIMTFLPVFWLFMFLAHFLKDAILSWLAHRRLPPTHMLLNWGWRPRRHFSAASIRDTYLPLFNLWMHMYYLTGAAYTLKIINCAGEPGEEYLVASPDIKCWEGEHRVLLGWGGLAFLLYFPGQLGTYIYVLFVMVPKYGLYHPSVFANFGFIYCRFEEELWWWEMVEYIRKIGLVVLMEYVVEPIEQSILAAFIIGVVLMANMYFRPYIKAEYDKFDMLMSSVQTMIVLLGVLVYDRTKNENADAAIAVELGVPPPETNDALEYVLLAMVTAVFAYGYLALRFDISSIAYQRWVSQLREEKSVHLPEFLDIDAVPEVLGWLEKAGTDESRRFRKLELLAASGMKTYSTKAKATANRREIYAKLLEAQPLLLGWLLKPERKGADGPLGHLVNLLSNDAEEIATDEYRMLSDLISNPRHAAPLALWLSESATTPERTLVRELMHEIANHIIVRKEVKSQTLPRRCMSMLLSPLAQSFARFKNFFDRNKHERRQLTEGSVVRAVEAGPEVQTPARPAGLNAALVRAQLALRKEGKQLDMLQRNEIETYLEDLMLNLNCEAVALIPTKASKHDTSELLPRILLHESQLDDGTVDQEEVDLLTRKIDWELKRPSPATLCAQTEEAVLAENVLFDKRFISTQVDGASLKKGSRRMSPTAAPNWLAFGLEAISQLAVPVYSQEMQPHGYDGLVAGAKPGANLAAEESKRQGGPSLVGVILAINKAAFAGHVSGLPFKPVDAEEAKLCAERVSRSSMFKRDYYSKAAATYIQRLLRGKAAREEVSKMATEKAHEVKDRQRRRRKGHRAKRQATPPDDQAGIVGPPLPATEAAAAEVVAPAVTLAVAPAAAPAVAPAVAPAAAEVVAPPTPNSLNLLTSMIGNSMKSIFVERVVEPGSPKETSSHVV